MGAALSAPESRRAEALRVLRGEVAASPSPRSEGPLLLGMGQAAKYLGVSRPTMWRILQTGQLTKLEVLPGSFRMRRADLDAFAAGGPVTRRGRATRGAEVTDGSEQTERTMKNHGKEQGA